MVGVEEERGVTEVRSAQFSEVSVEGEWLEKIQHVRKKPAGRDKPQIWLKHFHPGDSLSSIFLIQAPVPLLNYQNVFPQQDGKVFIQLTYFLRTSSGI